MSEATETKRPQWIRQAVDFGALVAFMAAYFITRDMICLLYTSPSPRDS